MGESTWEEFNVLKAGASYGWPSEVGACSGCEYVNPIYAYRHSDTPAHVGSITSVLVHTGDTLPSNYQNKVFIAGYSVGWIKELTFDSQLTSLISERTFDSQAGATAKLDQGPDGNLHDPDGNALTYQWDFGNGKTSTVADPTMVFTNAGDTVSFSASGLDDEDGALPASAYKWTVVFHHADQVHPSEDNIVGPAGGSITIARTPGPTQQYLLHHRRHTA